MTLIPRLHLVELEDLPWFPNIIRDYATDFLHFAETLMAFYRPVVPILAEALRSSGETTVVDLCAGGGGSISDVQRELAKAGVSTRIILTDKYPNLEAFARLEREGLNIEGLEESVDATSVPHELKGFRTVFNAFHHFKPSDARAVLKSAVDARQPIGVFEIPERSLHVIIATPISVPFFVLFATPFIRPFRWSRILFTYPIPLVTLTCLWDGTVSQLRAYSPDELLALAADLGDVGYTWKAGKVRVLGHGAHLTWLTGVPSRTA